MSETILEKIVECLNKGETKINIQDIKQNLSEDEKNLVLFINLILEKYHCFTPKEIPYSYCKDMNLTALKQPLIYIALNTKNKLLSCKIYDFLWLKFKDIKSAQKAFRGFIKIICTEYEYEKNYYLFNRCVSIFESTNEKSLEFELMKALYRIIEQGKDDDCVYSFRILKLAYEKKYLPLAQIVPLMEQKLENYDPLSNTNLFLDLSCLLEKVYFDRASQPYKETSCNINEISKLRRNRVDIHLKSVNDTQQHPKQRINALKKALKELKGLAGTEDERCILHRNLSELQSLFNKSFTTFSESYDISTNINYWNEITEKLNDTEMFYLFVYHTKLFDYESAKKNLIKEEEGMVYKHLCVQEILYKSGAVKAILPNWMEVLENDEKKEMLPFVEKYCAQNYEDKVNFGMRYILSLVKKRNFNIETEIKSVVKSSYFVPETRKNIFIKALMMGIEGDFVSAISIIAPQIENAVRELAATCGDAVTKINSDTTEEVLSLEQLLQLPKLNESIDEKILFNIKLVFSSAFGFNLRNEIAHGLYDDNDFERNLTFFAWWFTLHICVVFSKLEKPESINNKLK